MKALAPWLAVAVAVLGVYAMRGIAVDARSDIRAANDSIAVLLPVVEQYAARVDSLSKVAERRDTVLVRVTTRATSAAHDAADRAHAVADSLHAHADSTEAMWLDSLTNAHADEVRAVWVIADERLAWGDAWRDAFVVADSALTAERSLSGQRAFLNGALQGALRRERTRARVTEYIALAAVAKVAYDVLAP